MSTLVIDVGSSSVRVLLFDNAAEPIADASVRQLIRFSRHAAADAEHLRKLTEQCIDQILTHPAAADIAAVGMATFVGNLLGVDAEGAPVTPILTYADMRSAPDAETLAQSVSMQAAHARTGCRIHPAYHPAKLAWMRRTNPDQFARAAQWTDFATYCYRVWFGRDVPCSYSIASWSGLLNRESLTWDTAWLETLGLEASALPRLADYDEVYCGLSSAYAARWPNLNSVPFYLAVGDGAAANIGSGGSTPDHPVLTVGTTAALRVVTPEPGRVPLGLWAYRVDAKRHLIGGATSEGGSVYAWATAALKLDSAGLDNALLARSPGSHGLTVLPLFAGERSPNYRADATGTIHGLRLDTAPLDILHALIEAVALRLRVIFDLMGRPGEFVLAGGGALSQSPAWTQITADALGIPLYLVDQAEPTGRGVALLCGLTHNGDPIDAPSVRAIIRPRPGIADTVAALLDRQKTLYAALYGE
ncbi:MAG: gluconokinase [Anaerolineae bacterium]|nr:gluconokinase [Anaerolineae bacterium]